MRHALILVGVFLLFGCSVGAQVSPENSQLLPSSDSVTSVAPASAPMSFAPVGAPTGANASTPSEPAELPQGVYGVFENYYWQAYIGYTFVRFYEVPSLTQNENGFNYSIVYYLKDWVAADGEFVATFGSQSGTSSRFLLGMGGARFRWVKSRELELWAHGLMGASEFTPKTAYGKEQALGYELGGGFDLNPRHRRWAYRVEGDLVGTRYFSTYQFSPKVSVGIVFKF